MGKLLDLLDTTANQQTGRLCAVAKAKLDHPDLADDIDHAIYDRPDKSASTVIGVFQQLGVDTISIGMIGKHRRSECRACR